MRLSANIFKMCSRNKGPRAGCSVGRADSGEQRPGGWDLRAVPTNFKSQVTCEGIRSIRPSSQEPRNCAFAEDTSSLQQLNKEKRARKEMLHRARPKLMLSALHLHIYT